jgi:hypothetical protein
MKTLKKHSLLILAAVLGITTLQAQTADEIVAKYIDALGGRTVISSVKSLIIESSVDYQGSDAPSTTYILAGKGYKTETDFNGQKMVQCVTPDGGWAVLPMSPTPTVAPPEQVKSSQGQLQIGGPLVDYAAKGYKLESVGKDSADYKLHLTGSGLDVMYYINIKTNLTDKQISKASMNGQQMEITVAFSDYRKTDAGFTLPYAQQLDLPQASVNITHKKVTVNGPVDPAIFNMPK